MENQLEKAPDKGEIIAYHTDGSIHLDVKLLDDTVWLNRQQIALLFNRDVKTIGKHINNALSEELQDIPTVANFAIVQTEGGRTVTRNVDHYNLDMILSIGYRVKSSNGVKFRQWANRVLKDHLLKVSQHFESRKLQQSSIQLASPRHYKTRWKSITDNTQGCS